MEMVHERPRDASSSTREREGARATGMATGPDHEPLRATSQAWSQEPRARTVQRARSHGEGDIRHGFEAYIIKA